MPLLSGEEDEGTASFLDTSNLSDLTNLSGDDEDYEDFYARAYQDEIKSITCENPPEKIAVTWHSCENCGRGFGLKTALDFHVKSCQ